MIKNSIKFIVSIFLSFISIYIISDILILPYIFYVEETIVPNVISQNISTGKIILDENGQKKSEKIFKRDKLISKKEWDDEGVLIEE